jgi:hypothetical protein
MEEVSLTFSIDQTSPPLEASSDALTGVLRFLPVLLEVVSARLAEDFEDGPARV